MNSLVASTLGKDSNNFWSGSVDFALSKVSARFKDPASFFKRSLAIGTNSMGKSAIAAPSNSIAEPFVGVILSELAFCGTQAVVEPYHIHW